MSSSSVFSPGSSPTKTPDLMMDENEVRNPALRLVNGVRTLVREPKPLQFAPTFTFIPTAEVRVSTKLQLKTQRVCWQPERSYKLKLLQQTLKVNEHIRVLQAHESTACSDRPADAARSKRRENHRSPSEVPGPVRRSGPQLELSPIRKK